MWQFRNVKIIYERCCDRDTYCDKHTLLANLEIFPSELLVGGSDRAQCCKLFMFTRVQIDGKMHTFHHS